MTDSEEQGSSGQQPTNKPADEQTKTVVDPDKDSGDNQPKDHPSQQFGEQQKQEVKRQWQPKPRSESEQG
jgi:hypothetical protein